MDVFFSTVVREGPIAQGGELVRVDWATKKVLGKTILAPTDPLITEKDDANPRGNSRGGRGIIRHGDTLYVAIYHSLLLFDTALNQRDRITNNLFVGLHEMCKNNGTIWITSTAIDGVIGMDVQGNLLESWWARENPRLLQLFNLEPLPIDKTADNRMRWLKVLPARQPSHTHLNASAVHKGHLYVLLNKLGVVYNTSTDSVILNDPSIAGCHNLVFMGNRMLINDTLGRRVMVYSHDGQLIRAIRLLDFPEVRDIYEYTCKSARSRFTGFLNPVFKYINKSTDTTLPLFLRGLSPVNESRIIVGFSPATIIEIDIENGKLLDLFNYSQDVAVCIHGLLAWK